MKIYKTDNDYILDVLEAEQDKLFEELYNNLTGELKFKFSKLMAVINTIEKLNLENQ